MGQASYPLYQPKFFIGPTWLLFIVAPGISMLIAERTLSLILALNHIISVGKSLRFQQAFDV